MNYKTDHSKQKKMNKKRLQKLPKHPEQTNRIACMFSFPDVTSSSENSRKKNIQGGNDKDHQRKQKRAAQDNWQYMCMNRSPSRDLYQIRLQM